MLSSSCSSSLLYCASRASLSALSCIFIALVDSIVHDILHPNMICSASDAVVTIQTHIQHNTCCITKDFPGGCQHAFAVMHCQYGCHSCVCMLIVTFLLSRQVRASMALLLISHPLVLPQCIVIIPQWHRRQNAYINEACVTGNCISATCITTACLLCAGGRPGHQFL